MTSRKTIAGWLALHVVSAVTLLGVASWFVSENLPLDRFDLLGSTLRIRQVRDRINPPLHEPRLDLLLLGNSTLAAATDQNHIRKGLAEHGLESALVSQNATGTAFWYLVFKNVIGESPRKPKAIALFVVDDLLTDATKNTTGKYSAPIRVASGADEGPFVKTLMRNFAKEQAFTEGSLFLLGSAWPAYSRKSLLRSWLFGTVNDLPRIAVNGLASSDLLPEYVSAEDKVFSRGMFRDNDPNESQPRLVEGPERESPYRIQRHELSFDERLRDSFLEPMIEICNRKGVGFIVVKLKTRPAPGKEGERKAKRDAAYTKSLAAFLEEREVAFVDYSQDPALGPLFFSDQNHLNERGRHALAPRLVEDLAAAVQAVAGKRPVLQERQPGQPPGLGDHRLGGDPIGDD